MTTIVVGAGVMGLATAWHLARAGEAVTVLEQGPIPNPLAASWDSHRLIRALYPNSPGYTRMALDAYAAWDEVWAAAGVRHLVLRSFTAVYGARGQNPSFLTEDKRPDSGSRLAWVRDKAEAEEHAFSFSRRYPGLGVTVLRFATLLGPGVHSFYTRLLSKRAVAVLLGYDPLLQLLHPDDALEAAMLALAQGPSQVVNVVPRTPLTLLTALHLADRVTLPVPHAVAYPLAELWWGTGVGEAPAGFLDYARFPFVADGAKARRTLGFEPRYTSRQALEAFLTYRYPETRRPADAEPEPAEAGAGEIGA